ncbi:MAG: TetR/AcrR family transcriptional regulator [Burkholderiaceae bacterium]
MKAKSDHLAQARRSKPPLASGKTASKPVRMPREKRRADILARAGEYFAEYGLTAQTRGLADACGISQRLLYSFFPTKSALIQEVYRDCIEGPFKAVWLVQLVTAHSPCRPG